MSKLMFVIKEKGTMSFWVEDSFLTSVCWLIILYFCMKIILAILK